MLKIQQFIKNHIAWETLLIESPYYLQITRDKVFNRNLIMFKYSQVFSDFHDPIVRECRGLILDEETLEPVTVPFFKFGNYGESYCPNIDWSSAYCLQKVDGSLIKIVRLGNNLLISTNGTIDADKAPVTEQLGCKYKSFGDIVKEVLASKCVGVDAFEEGFTYMFELVSPWTRVVVPWKDNDLYFLGVRDNKTFDEQLLFSHELAKKFKIPKKFDLHTLDDCLAATKDMPWDEEGYVVVDKHFNRVKVKSPAYCAIHHMKNNNLLSYARGIDIVKSNEIDEVVLYFPEYKIHLNSLKTKFDEAIAFIENAWIEFLKVNDTLSTRKDKALKIIQLFKQFKGVGFALLDEKVKSPKDWIYSCPSNQLIKYFGLNDK